MWKSKDVASGDADGSDETMVDTLKAIKQQLEDDIKVVEALDWSKVCTLWLEEHDGSLIEYYYRPDKFTSKANLLKWMRAELDSELFQVKDKKTMPLDVKKVMKSMKKKGEANKNALLVDYGFVGHGRGGRIYPTGNNTPLSSLASGVFGKDFTFFYVGCGQDRKLRFENGAFGYNRLKVVERDDGIHLEFPLFGFERRLYKDIDTPNDEPDETIIL